MDNVAQKIYFGMDVSDKFVEIFALTPDSAQNRRMKIENNRESRICPVSPMVRGISRWSFWKKLEPGEK